MCTNKLIFLLLNQNMIGLWLFSLSFLSPLSVSEPQQQETSPILCPVLWLFSLSDLSLTSISEPAARNYTNMLACALVYGYLAYQTAKMFSLNLTPDFTVESKTGNLIYGALILNK